jgi:hypothetical protein
MNVDGGSLEFDAVLNTGQLDDATEETKKRLQGLSDATVEAGDKMDDAFDKAGQSVSQLETKIKQLKEQQAELGKIISDASKWGTPPKALTDEYENISREISEAEARIAQYRDTVNTTETAHTSFRSQLRAAREELIRLEQAGLRNTQQFSDLQLEVGRLQDAMDDASKQARVLANDENQFQGVIEGLSGIAGGFSAVTGTVGLFAGENENLEKIMTKVQSVMAITIGLQQVAVTLNKDSYFRLVTLTKIQNLYSAALSGTSTALVRFGISAGVARIAAQALMATLTLGLGIAITSAVTLISKYIDKQKEAKKATEEFNNKIAETAAKPIASINQLSLAWSKLGDNIKAKEKFIKDNKDSFDSLGVSVKNAADAEKLLIDNKEAFIKAQILKAKAMAATELAAEKYKSVLQKMQDAEPTKYVGTGQYRNKQYDKGSLVQQFGRSNSDPEKLLKEGKIAVNKEWTDWDNKQKAYQSELDNAGKKLFQMAATFTAEEQKLLAQIGQSGSKITEGSILAQEKVISGLQEEYKNAATELKRNGLAQEIKKQQSLLDKMNILSSSKSTPKTKTDDPFTKDLETKKKAYSEYFKWLNAGYKKEAQQEFAETIKGGNTYLEYLKKLSEDTTLTKAQIHQVSMEIANETDKTIIGEFEKSLQDQLNKAGTVLETLQIIADKRKELESDDSGLKEQKTEVLNKQNEDITKKAEDETRSILKSYSDYLEEKINFELQYGERKKKLDNDLIKSTTENERKIVLAQLAGLEKDRKKYEKRTDNEDYDNLLQEYRSFEQKKLDITNEYDDKIALATAQKNDELIKRLTEEKNKETSSLALDELQNSGVWEKLFGNLDDLTINQIEELISKIEAQKAQLGIELNPQDLKAILDKLNDAKDEIRSRNPFKALVDSVKEYGKATDNDAKKKALTNSFKSAAESIDLVSGAMDSVVNGIKTAGIEMDETTEKIIGDIGGMLDAASKLAVGIASGNPLSIIEGSIEVISHGLSLIDSSSARKNQKIKEEIEHYNALVDVYSLLIDKQKAFIESLSGKQAVDAYKEGLDMIVAQQQSAAASLKNWFSSGASMFSHSQGYKYNESFGSSLSQDKLFSMNAEQWEQWIKNNAEQWARLPQEVQDYANSVIDAEERTKELTESMKEATVGFSLSEAASQLSELVTQSDLTFEKISESFYGHMQKAVLRLIQSKYINDQLDTWYNNFAKDMEDGELSEYEAKNRQKEYEDIVNRANAEYEAVMKAIGISLGDNENITSLSGAIKGASQESIDLLAGQTNAMRVNQMESIEIMRNQLAYMASIDARIGVSNQHLEQIERNTSGYASDPLRAEGIINN